MQETTVEVLLYPPDQKSPRTGGPTGKLRKITNGVARKVREDGSLRVEKRPAWVPMSKAIFDTLDGSSLGSGGITNPSLLASLGDELVAIGDSAPYVYSAPKVASGQFVNANNTPRRIMTPTARKTVVESGTQTIDFIDAASIGDVFCYTFRRAVAGVSTCHVMFTGKDGAPIRLPFPIVTGRIKVVADASHFWLFTDDGGTTLTASVWSTAGVQLAASTVDTLAHAGDSWDVEVAPGVGVCSVRVLASFGLRLTTMSYAASVITHTGHDNFSEGTHGSTNDYGCAFLSQASSDGHVYVGTVTSGDGYTLFVVRMDAAGVTEHIYDVYESAALPLGVANITGYVIPGTQDIYVSWTTLAQTGGTTGGPFINNLTRTAFVPHASTSSAPTLLRSASLASRPFLLDTRWVMLVYYASVVGVNLFNNPGAVGQPTYFLVDIVSQNIVGRFEHGTASMDWTAAGWDPSLVQTLGPGFFQLPSPFTDVLGAVYLPAGYAADLTTVQKIEDVLTTNKLVPLVAMMHVAFGGPAPAIEYAGETLIPGPMAISFSGAEFASSNIELAPEQPTLAQSTDAHGHLAVLATYAYVLMFSILDPAGRRIRSAVTIPVTGTLTGVNNMFTLTIPTLRLTTHATVLIDVFRTVWNATTGVASTGHRRITVDAPQAGDSRTALLNDPTVDTVTFQDRVWDATANIGAPLYTDDGTLDFNPCPTFSVGAVFNDRVYVAGYDDRVYYSFSKVPGDALAFNQDEFFFTLPTSERVTGLFPLDGRLLIMCEKSWWYVDGSTLDATGAGSNPTPLRLPMSNGGTGTALLVSAGVIYASSAGGLWLMTRGLENIYIGKNVEDETTGATFVGACVDANQRATFFTTTQCLVYDQTVSCWYVWTLPTAPRACAAWNGSIVYADASSSTMHLLTSGVTSDGGTPIVTTVAIQEVDLAGIAGFQLIWEVNVIGEWIGAHALNVAAGYDEDTALNETWLETFAISTVPYRFNFQPANIECSAIELTISDSFPGGVPSGGFALEGLGLFVGIERGTKYTATRLSPG